MCVGLSAKVIKITDGTALVDASGAKRNISVELLEDLEPGDVIIKWSDHNNSGHAWMYAGGDQIVEAVPAKSYANQIAVKSGAAAKLRRYGRSEGTPSKNYVMRYRY